MTTVNKSGTGVIVSLAQTVTAQNLIDLAQTALDDAGATTWSEAEVLAWLNEGIREYSQHLPRELSAEIAAVADTREYALPWNTLAVHSVEYPADEQPPVYLLRISYQSLRWASGRYYDFLSRLDLTTAPQLWLSFAPAAGETIRVRYQAPHAYTLAANEYVTMPSEHHHVLVGYVLYAAARQLQQAEQAHPTNNSSLLMSQLASNTRRLELAYLNALNRILYHRQGQSGVRHWGTAEGIRRIY